MLYTPKVLSIIIFPTPKITITPPTLVDDEYITSRRQQLTEQLKIPKETHFQATVWLDNMPKVNGGRAMSLGSAILKSQKT